MSAIYVPIDELVKVVCIKYVERFFYFLLNWFLLLRFKNNFHYFVGVIFWNFNYLLYNLLLVKSDVPLLK